MAAGTATPLRYTRPMRIREPAIPAALWLLVLAGGGCLGEGDPVPLSVRAIEASPGAAPSAPELVLTLEVEEPGSTRSVQALTVPRSFRLAAARRPEESVSVGDLHPRQRILVPRRAVAEDGSLDPARGPFRALLPQQERRIELSVEESFFECLGVDRERSVFGELTHPGWGSEEAILEQLNWKVPVGYRVVTGAPAGEIWGEIRLTCESSVSDTGWRTPSGEAVVDRTRTAVFDLTAPEPPGVRTSRRPEPWPWHSWRAVTSSWEKSLGIRRTSTGPASRSAGSGMVTTEGLGRYEVTGTVIPDLSRLIVPTPGPPEIVPIGAPVAVPELGLEVRLLSVHSDLEGLQVSRLVDPRVCDRLVAGDVVELVGARRVPDVEALRRALRRDASPPVFLSIFRQAGAGPFAPTSWRTTASCRPRSAARAEPAEALEPREFFGLEERARPGNGAGE